MARTYRKRPVVVEAVQWTGNNHAEMCEFIDPEVFEIIPHVGLVIQTLEGDHHASPGDYIIKGVNGEFYPCKPDIFAKTYEAALPTLTPPNEPLTMEDAKKERYIWFTPLNDWAKVTPFGVLFFGSEELMTWETLCEDWGYRFKAYRRPPEGDEDT